MRIETLEDVEVRATELLARSEDLLTEARRRRRRVQQPVSIQRRSANRKLAPQAVEIAKSGRPRNMPRGPYVTSTYVSIAATCPDSCRFKGAGCYAQEGSAGGYVAERDQLVRSMSGLEVTRLEVRLLDRLYKDGIPQDGGAGGRDLRLHVSGETSCVDGAQALAGMAKRWLARGGGAVWTYTHRWREIPSETFGPIAALASVETNLELHQALERGYAPAMVVPEFPSPRAFRREGVKLIPCPAELGERTCTECRLCLDEDLVGSRTGIAFAYHGKRGNGDRDRKIKHRLRVLQGT